MKKRRTNLKKTRGKSAFPGGLGPFRAVRPAPGRAETSLRRGKTRIFAGKRGVKSCISCRGRVIMGPRHKKVQAGTECWNHPAPCLRREDLHTQRLTPHIATLIIPCHPGEYKAGRRILGTALVCGAVYGFISRTRRFFAASRKGNGGGPARGLRPQPPRKAKQMRRKKP